jgi:hypothetical protein
MSSRPRPQQFRRICRLLLRRFGCVDGQAQFALSGAQMFFGLGAMAFHVVVVGGAGMLHLMNGFDDVLVNAIEIVPIANLGHSRARRVPHPSRSLRRVG